MMLSPLSFLLLFSLSLLSFALTPMAFRVVRWGGAREWGGGLNLSPSSAAELIMVRLCTVVKEAFPPETS